MSFYPGFESFQTHDLSVAHDLGSAFGAPSVAAFDLNAFGHSFHQPHHHQVVDTGFGGFDASALYGGYQGYQLPQFSGFHDFGVAF